MQNYLTLLVSRSKTIQIQILNGNLDLLEIKFLSVILQASELQSLENKDTTYSLDDLYYNHGINVHNSHMLTIIVHIDAYKNKHKKTPCISTTHKAPTPTHPETIENRK